uniref:C2H2-type domain-containing protein n=1 Tax=Knipowitschia caucasica TaxID=637954 RepID=A0AAV2KLY4_KNICA
MGKHPSGQLCSTCGDVWRRSHSCPGSLRPHACSGCSRRFSSESSLRVHSAVHSASHQVRCKFCNVGFKTKAEKVRHERSHLRQSAPYLCPSCPRGFTSYRLRAAHKKEHVDKYKCGVCGLGFFEEQHFLRHTAVHTGERPHVCDVCGAGFKQSTHLKSHTRLHTGERPYRCPHCDRAFNHNASKRAATGTAEEERREGYGGGAGGGGARRLEPNTGSDPEAPH